MMPQSVLIIDLFPQLASRERKQQSRVYCCLREVVAHIVTSHHRIKIYDRSESGNPFKLILCERIYERGCRHIFFPLSLGCLPYCSEVDIFTGSANPCVFCPHRNREVFLRCSQNSLPREATCRYFSLTETLSIAYSTFGSTILLFVIILTEHFRSMRNIQQPCICISCKYYLLSGYCITNV